VVRHRWDRRKARVNLAKHGIGFEEAQSALADPVRVSRVDTEHAGTAEIHD
jgi:uncharacterized DUF497 family protein